MPTGAGMHKNFGPDNKAAQSVEGQQRLATINTKLASNATASNAATTTTTAATTAKGRRRRRYSRAMRKSRRRGRRGTRRR